MNFGLKDAELRVLGTLIEKEITTPEYYPLTLNSLVAACNQKSNRWPITEYADHDVLVALEGLRAHGFAAEIVGGGRVPKYAQRFTQKLNLGRRETAILCVLMLRGQQTAGEIRTRTDRMHSFDDLSEVELVLHKLIEYPEGQMAQKLAPAPGMKEPRYAQTLGGMIEQTVAAQAPAPAVAAAPVAARLTALEEEVARLREEVDELRRKLESVL